MKDRGELDLLARLRHFGVAVASDCDTQALSGFLDSVATFRDWIVRDSNNVDMHQSTLTEGRLKFAVADDLRILLVNKQQINLVQASKAVESALRLVMTAPCLPSQSVSQEDLRICTFGLIMLFLNDIPWSAISIMWSHICTAACVTTTGREDTIEMAEELEIMLRQYMSRQCTVAVHRRDHWQPADLHQKQSAELSATGLQCPEPHAPLLAKGHRILNGISSPVFAAFTEADSDTNGMPLVNIWRFMEPPAGSSTAATSSQPKAGLQWLNGGELRSHLNLGAVLNGELCLTAFCSSEDWTGAMDLFSLDSLDTPTRRTTMVCQHQIDAVRRRGASLVAVGDLLVSFGSVADPKDSLLRAPLCLLGGLVDLGSSSTQRGVHHKPGMGTLSGLWGTTCTILEVSRLIQVGIQTPANFGSDHDLIRTPAYCRGLGKHSLWCFVSSVSRRRVFLSCQGPNPNVTAGADSGRTGCMYRLTHSVAASQSNVMVGCLRCVVRNPEEHREVPGDESTSYHQNTILYSKSEHRGEKETSTIKIEGSNRNGTYLTGVLAHADRITINRRYYNKETLIREVQRFHQELVLPGNAFGELTHPECTSSLFQSVHPTAVSHQIMAVWWRGNQLHGLIRLLDTADGRRAARLLETGQQLGASSRSWTSLVPDATSGTVIVQDDLHLITFDLTPRPASGSFLRPVPHHLVPALQSRILHRCKDQLLAESGLLI